MPIIGYIETLALETQHGTILKFHLPLLYAVFCTSKKMLCDVFRKSKAHVYVVYM